MLTPHLTTTSPPKRITLSIGHGMRRCLSHCMQAKKRMTTKVLLVGICICMSITSKAQPKMVVETAFAQIKTIPSHYAKGQQKMPLDEAYQKIVTLGPSAIPFLVDKLTDTTRVDINNTCKQTSLRKGDLAFFLINDIEHIPYYTVTKTQWCVFNFCSVLPV